jgi:hypothetical protein
MEILLRLDQLIVGEIYRLCVTYTGDSTDEDKNMYEHLNCDIVTRVTRLTKLYQQIEINTMLTNNPDVWPIGHDFFELDCMNKDHLIEFQKL